MSPQFSLAAQKGVGEGGLGGDSWPRQIYWMLNAHDSKKFCVKNRFTQPGYVYSTITKALNFQSPELWM